MTGLDASTDRIIELCCFITDADLNLLDPVGYEAVIHQPRAVMDSMGDWCVQHHGASGLTAAVLASQTTPEQAAAGLLAYIKQHVPEARVALLAGNSVHADKAFLLHEPYAQVMEHLHYRILDASSLKEAVRRWGSDEMLLAAPEKKGAHLAKDDILDSIEEMRFYRRVLFPSK